MRNPFTEEAIKDIDERHHTQPCADSSRYDVIEGTALGNHEDGRTFTQIDAEANHTHSWIMVSRYDLLLESPSTDDEEHREEDSDVFH